MFEVVDSRRGTFEAFKAFTLATNDGEAAQFRPDRTNRYTRWSGVPVEFDPEEGILNSNADDDLLAEGDVVWADGSGCVVVQHPRLNQSLVISLKDLNNPYIVALDGMSPPEEFAASCTGMIDFRESDLFDPGIVLTGGRMRHHSMRAAALLGRAASHACARRSDAAARPGALRRHAVSGSRRGRRDAPGRARPGAGAHHV